MTAVRAIPALCFTFFCFQPVCFSGIVLDDFRRTDPDMIPARGAEVKILEDSGAASLMVSWTDDHGAWTECAYRRPPEIPGGSIPAPYAVAMDLCVSPSNGIARAAVRMIDAGHEMFQWQAEVPPCGENGRVTVFFPIDAKASDGHWGGDNDGYVRFPLRLGGYAFVFSNSRVPAGCVKISNVRIAKVPSVAGLVSDRFPNLVNASGDYRFGLSVTNPCAETVRAAASGSITDSRGKTLGFSSEAVIPPFGSGVIPIALADRTPGLRRMKCGVEMNGVRFRADTSFAVCDPVERGSARDGFLFGICSHTERYSPPDRTNEIAAAAAAGASVLRAGAYWTDLEPSPGQWRWDLQDELVAAAREHGLELQAILGFCPVHAAYPQIRQRQEEAYRNKEPDPWKICLFSPPEEEPWRRYVRMITSRYRGKIRFYEVWNEPDLGFWKGDTGQYIAMLRAASEEIRQTDPEAALMTGGFATVLEHAGRAANPDLQERVLAEASDAFDIHAFHQHGLFGEFHNAVTGELRRIRSKMKNPRPLYFNETAVSSSYIGEMQQASVLVKKLVFAMSEGAVGYTWYDLRNDGDDPMNMEHNYGLLNRDFSPKAVFVAFMECVRQLNGGMKMGVLDMGRDIFAPVINTPRGRIAAVWNENPANAESVWLLRVHDLPCVVKTEITGASSKAGVSRGFVQLKAEDEPVFWNLGHGVRLPDPPAEILKLEAPDTAVCGAPVPARLRCFNPTPDDLTLRLIYAGKDGKEDVLSIGLKSGEKKFADVEFSPPDAGSPRYSMKLRFDSLDFPLSGVLRKNIPVVVPVTEISPEQRPPDWILDASGSVHDFCLADPNLAGHGWRDGNDLSAKIWVWTEEGGSLRIRAEVRDDRHCQNETPQYMWRGDSVQIAVKRFCDEKPFEIGAALNDSGEILQYVWASPDGFQVPADGFSAAAEKTDCGMVYDISLPCSAFGLDKEVLEGGFLFNMIVNDNDGYFRKCFVRIAEGLGEAKNTGAFPALRKMSE